jgi:hypothetical protein
VKRLNLKLFNLKPFDRCNLNENLKSKFKSLQIDLKRIRIKAIQILMISILLPIAIDSI